MVTNFVMPHVLRNLRCYHLPSCNFSTSRSPLGLLQWKEFVFLRRSPARIHISLRHSRSKQVQCSPGGANGDSVTHKPSTPLSTIPNADGVPPSKTPWVKFCCSCGSPVEQAIPPGEDMFRSVCTSCKRVDYQNPKTVAGCVVVHEGKVLLCRRGIEPCKGLWTLPAGYVEIGETVAEGATRETWEEANAVVEGVLPYFHIDIPRIGQSYRLYRGTLLPPYSFSPGPETLETGLFAMRDIPFDEIAFSAIRVVLQQLAEDLDQGSFSVHEGVILKKDGYSPSDPDGYEYKSTATL